MTVNAVPPGLSRAAPRNNKQSTAAGKPLTKPARNRFPATVYLPAGRICDTSGAEKRRCALSQIEEIPRLSDTIVTLPNIITLTRVLAVLPVMGLIVMGRGDNAAVYLWIALAVMVLSELTDWLDGYVARRMHLVSTSGKVLDPMADSIYRIGVFVAIVANGWMPLWMLLILVARDIGVSELRLVAQRAGITLAARTSGKLKAVSQGVAQFAAVVCHAAGGGATSPDILLAVWLLLLVSTCVTLWSLVDYMHAVLGALIKNGKGGRVRGLAR